MFLHEPLKPRRGRILHCLAVIRVSSKKQEEKSKSRQTQENLLRRAVAQSYKGPVDWTFISTCASGEHLDRDEITELILNVKTGQFDLVITEDLGRIMRSVEVRTICGICVDFLTRLIAINDNLDTTDPNWPDHALFAGWQHEKHNETLSRRIKERKREKFLAGADLPRFIAGYVIPKNPKTDDDLKKDDDATTFIEGAINRTLIGMPDTIVADWLNEQEFPTGPYCDSDKWNGKSYQRWITNPLLAGLRVKNKRHTVKNYESGHRKSKNAPRELRMERKVPHLAHISMSLHKTLVGYFSKRSAKDGRGRPEGTGYSRTNAPWPSNHVYCGICGRLYYRGGHGRTEFMMCSGCREYVCWNGITFDGRVMNARISNLVFTEIESLADFDPAMLQLLKEEASNTDNDLNRKKRALESEIKTIRRQAENAEQAILDGYSGRSLIETLQVLEDQLADKVVEHEELEGESQEKSLVLPSAEKIKQLARESFGNLAADDPEMGHLMRLLIPKIVVFPVQLCEGGRVVLRAKFRMFLSDLLPDKRLQASMRQPLERILTVDLFDPPQREKYRKLVIAGRATGMTEKMIAAKYGLTITAVQRASALQRKMNQLGLSDPYLPVTDPSVNNTKLRRQWHKRYDFKPKPDAGEI